MLNLDYLNTKVLICRISKSFEKVFLAKFVLDL